MKHMQTFGFVPSRAVPCRSFSGWEAAAAELFLVIHLLLLWCSATRCGMEMRDLRTHLVVRVCWRWCSHEQLVPE